MTPSLERLPNALPEPNSHPLSHVEAFRWATDEVLIDLPDGRRPCSFVIHTRINALQFVSRMPFASQPARKLTAS